MKKSVSVLPEGEEKIISFISDFSKLVFYKGEVGKTKRFADLQNDFL